jgi:competence protein ComEA
LVVAVLLYASVRAAWQPLRQPGELLTPPLNVNTASARELELLPGVGPALAGRIVADRQANGAFGTVAELDRVKGVGPATLERWEPYIEP